MRRRLYRVFRAVVVITPDNLLEEYSDKALMYITGGGNDDAPPTMYDEDVLLAAVMAQSVQTLAVVLFQIPNQPVWKQLHTTSAGDRGR